MYTNSTPSEALHIINKCIKLFAHKINAPIDNGNPIRATYRTNSSSSFKTSSKQTSTNQYEIKIGSMVKHDKFGGGTVIGYEGNENDLRIEIKFQNHGIKMLAMEYAKLTKV